MWDEQADVVVVGYGYAGAIAALEAHKAGADILLIEKMPDPGGISITSGGNVRTVVRRRRWFPISARHQCRNHAGQRLACDGRGPCTDAGVFRSALRR